MSRPSNEELEKTYMEASLGSATPQIMQMPLGELRSFGMEARKDVIKFLESAKEENPNLIVQITGSHVGFLVDEKGRRLVWS